MKTKIYKFNPIIYPFPILVCRYEGKETENELKEMFYIQTSSYDVKDATDEFFITPTTTARTICVVSKDTDSLYYLIILYRPKLITHGIIAHEASHVANFMARELGFCDGSLSNDEPMAYIVQWVADCTESILSKKPESMGGELLK